MIDFFDTIDKNLIFSCFGINTNHHIFQNTTDIFFIINDFGLVHQGDDITVFPRCL